MIKEGLAAAVGPSFRKLLGPIPASALMLVELTIVDRNASSRQIVVDEFPVMLGRGDEADVCVEDPWVSRLHCVLNELEDVLVLCDLGSKNGVYLNGLRVDDGHVFPGDRFTLGLSEVRVQYQRRTAGKLAFRRFATFLTHAGREATGKGERTIFESRDDQHFACPKTAIAGQGHGGGVHLRQAKKRGVFHLGGGEELGRGGTGGQAGRPHAAAGKLFG